MIEEHKATCCGKLVEWSEYVANHGWCNDCLNPKLKAMEERMGDEEL